jgi:endonuclease YncB( thermonuclease family)
VNEIKTISNVDIEALYKAIPDDIKFGIRDQLTHIKALRKIDISSVPNVVAKNEWILTRLIKVIDGDTIAVAILMGSTVLKVSVRVSGIDCPETHKASEKEIRCGNLITEHVRTLIGDIVKVKFLNVDKWGGRWVGQIGLPNIPCGCLSTYLLEKGYAKAYSGAKKTSWTESELDRMLKTLE